MSAFQRVAAGSIISERGCGKNDGGGRAKRVKDKTGQAWWQRLRCSQQRKAWSMGRQVAPVQAAHGYLQMLFSPALGPNTAGPPCTPSMERIFSKPIAAGQPSIDSL